MTSPVAARSSRMLPALLLLFIGSGCAALIYEVVWFQMLSLIVGSSAISIGVLLGTFMGGMCIGSLLLPKYMSPVEHPLRMYAKLEIGIAICGVVILFGSPYIGQALRSFDRRRWLFRPDHGRALLRHLPADSDDLHGCHAARGGTLGRNHATRRFVARLLLRWQHRRRSARLPAHRLLPPAHARHDVRNVRGCGDQRRRRTGRTGARPLDAA